MIPAWANYLITCTKKTKEFVKGVLKEDRDFIIKMEKLVISSQETFSKAFYMNEEQKKNRYLEAYAGTLCNSDDYFSKSSKNVLPLNPNLSEVVGDLKKEYKKREFPLLTDDFIENFNR